MSTNDFLFWFVGICLAFALWWWKREDLECLIKRKKINIELIIGLEKDGLKIGNRSSFQNRKSHTSYRDIFWPVVPTASPGLIHATFLRYAIPLSKSGLKIVLFIFDEYSALVQDWQINKDHNWAINFVSSLEKMGLNKCNYKIVYQSKISKASRNAGRILPKIFRYLSKLRAEDLNRIAKKKDHINVDSKAIRYLKPILNMVYCLSVKGRFGFTFSGLDEELLWLEYSSIAKGEGLFDPVFLFIPIMNSITNSETNALDHEGNIWMADSREDIRFKIKKSLNTLPTGNGIAYVLKNIYFSLGNQFTIETCDLKNFTVSSMEEFLNIYSSEKIDEEKLVNRLTDTIQKILSGEIFKKLEESKLI